MRKLALVLAAALATSAGACGNPNAQAPTQEAGAAAAAPETGEHVPFDLNPTQQTGRTIFQMVCWTCHGQSGRGDGPAVKAGSITTAPPSFQTEGYARAKPDELERRFRAAMAGADPNHPHMQYVASIVKPEEFTAALSYVPVLAYPPEIPGSAWGGKAIFDFRCAGCHGKDGRGDGPAAETLIEVRPADFTRDTLIAQHNFDGLYQRIREGGRAVHGSAMPPWGVILSEGEIWDLVAYLATFQKGVLSPPPAAPASQ